MKKFITEKKTNKKRSKPSHRWVWWGLMFSTTLFGIFSLFGKGGYFYLKRPQTVYEELVKENYQLLQRQRQLKAEIFRLRDPRYLEFLARDRLDLIGQNEIFIIMEQPIKLNESSAPL